MRLIKPVTIADAMLISSTVAEPAAGETAWVSGTTYAVGDLVIRASTHRVYKRKVAGAGTTPPESDATNWEDFRPTNRWAMFDQEINTQTTGATPLTVTLAPGLCNSLALLELVGSQAQVTVTDGAGGPTVYGPVTVSLEQSSVADWYSYFFEPFSQRGTLILTDLPPYVSARVTITISGTGTMKCGGFIVGSIYSLGATQYNVTAGIRDYSKKETDSAGAVQLAVGKFSKRMRAKLQVAAGSVGQIQTLLTDLRATPVVWIGDDTGTIEPLTIFGFYRDFELDVAYPTVNFYSLDIEGMT